MSQETKKGKKKQVTKEKTNHKEEKSEENVKKDSNENVKLYVTLKYYVLMTLNLCIIQYC